jgi:hypothetical protein
MTGQMQGPAWPTESEMRILTDTGIYDDSSNENPKAQIRLAPREYADVMNASAGLLRDRITECGWIEPFVEFVEFKFMEQEPNIRGVYIVVKSVVKVTGTKLGKVIKKDEESHFFDTLRTLPKSGVDNAATEVAAEVFEDITDILLAVKRECDEISRSIRILDVGTEIKILSAAV